MTPSASPTGFSAATTSGSRTSQLSSTPSTLPDLIPCSTTSRLASRADIMRMSLMVRGKSSDGWPSTALSCELELELEAPRCFLLVFCRKRHRTQRRQCCWVKGEMPGAPMGCTNERRRRPNLGIPTICLPRPVRQSVSTQRLAS